MIPRPVCIGAESILEEVPQNAAGLFRIRLVAVGTIPPPLPPSVEEAYRKKCIELRRRMIEVEESNDAYRLRKFRLARGIRKMRLERAYLLEILAKRMRKNGSSGDGFLGIYDEDSEGSSEGPPTPHEKPLRSKRSHRRPVNSPPPFVGHQHPRPIAPSQGFPISTFEVPNHPFRESLVQHVPTTNGQHTIYQPHQSTFHHTTSFPLEHHVPRRPQPPQSAFNDFVQNWVLARPHEYPARSEEEVLQTAERLWSNPEMGQHRKVYEERHEHREQMYHQDVSDWEMQMERIGQGDRRDGELDVEADIHGESPQLPPAAQIHEGGVSTGFTSLNGADSRVPRRGERSGARGV